MRSGLDRSVKKVQWRIGACGGLPALRSALRHRLFCFGKNFDSPSLSAVKMLTVKVRGLPSGQTKTIKELCI